MKSPFWMLFGAGLRKIFCDHKGVHEDWGYRFGSGICENYCSKCGQVIRRVPLDDLPKDSLVKIIKLLKDKTEEKDSDGNQED